MLYYNKLMPRARSSRPTPSASRVIGYLRCSTTKQEESPAVQRAALETWCARAGVELLAVFEDVGVSGAAPLEARPGLLQALDALEAHGAGVLLVSRRDRLARDVVLAATVDALVERTGARVASCAGEGTESTDPASQLLRTLIDAFSAYERQLIRARTRAALAQKKARGELTGSAPLGRRVSADGRTLEIDPREETALALIRELRGLGYSYRQIIRELEARGIKNRAGGHWHPEAIARVLRAA